MIEMSVRHQNRVGFWRKMTESIVDARCVRLNVRTKRHAQEVNAREVRIDKQGVSFAFELVTVCAEISHAYAVSPLAGRICNHQIPVGVESTAESLRGKPEKKEKTAHPTTNNANVTDVEEQAANSLAVRELLRNYMLLSATGTDFAVVNLFFSAVRRNTLNEIELPSAKLSSASCRRLQATRLRSPDVSTRPVLLDKHGDVFVV
jgi:hypothetical protein